MGLFYSGWNYIAINRMKHKPLLVSLKLTRRFFMGKSIGLYQGIALYIAAILGVGNFVFIRGHCIDGWAGRKQCLSA